MPSVAPARSAPRSPAGSHVFHSPPRTAAAPGTIRRARASRSANARSAVASVSTSGVLPTGIPRAAAASTSMLSVPTAMFAIARRRGAASSTAASTRSVTSVRRPSTSRARATRSSWAGGMSPGHSSTSCSARRRSSASNGSARVTNTRAMAGHSPGMGEIRVGCSGWNYADWRERVYPKGVPASRWLEHYATLFDTVEVNSTFYRLAKPKAVAAWLEATPPEFVFAVKASQYLTHMKRLIDIEQGIERFYAGIEPLARSPKMGPVLWQLPERFTKDVPRLAGALDLLPDGRHCFEFRHPSWFADDETLELLRWHKVALAIGDHPQRPWQPWVTTTDWSFVRFHYGARGRRGNYSESELKELAPKVAGLGVPTFAYFNNDWEGFAVKNALRMRALLS